MKTTLAEASRAPSAKQIEDIVMSAPVTDIHTHLYDPAFKELLLWGIDDLLGLSFTPQHSDARVLDPIVYKWQHSRGLIAQALTDKYSDLAQTGWQASRAEIERDAKDLFGGAFERFCQR